MTSLSLGVEPQATASRANLGGSTPAAVELKVLAANLQQAAALGQTEQARVKADKDLR